MDNNSGHENLYSVNSGSINEAKNLTSLNDRSSPQYYFLYGIQIQTSDSTKYWPSVIQGAVTWSYINEYANDRNGVSHLASNKTVKAQGQEFYCENYSQVQHIEQCTVCTNRMKKIIFYVMWSCGNHKETIWTIIKILVF